VNIYFIISVSRYIFGEIMLRSFTIVLLAFTILSANFSRLFVFAGFELNREYIAEELCVNKEKPQLACHGKCFLADKLKQAAEKEKKQEKEQQKHAFQEAFIVQKSLVKFAQPLIDIINTPEPQFHIVVNSTSIFQPPRV